MKKAICILLVPVMMLSLLLSGCSEKTGSAATPSSSLATPSSSVTASPPPDDGLPSYMQPLAKEGEDNRLSIAVGKEVQQGDPDTIWWWNYVREVLNIDVEVKQVTDPATYVPLAFASGELPDIFYGMRGVFGANEQVNYGSEEGLLVDMAPYITEKSMPYLTQLKKDNPEAVKSWTLPNGSIYAPATVYKRGYNENGSGIWSQLNVALLKELGLKEPETLDEFTEVLREFKKKGDDFIPFGGCSAWWLPPLNYLLTSFGYSSTADEWGLTPCLRNGKVVLPCYDREAFGEYLKLANTYYKEGLIDADYYTLDVASAQAKASAGTYGCMMYPAYLLLPDSYMDWWPVKVLTSEWKTEKAWPTVFSGENVDELAYSGGALITTACKNVELALRFVDWAYEPTSLHFELSVYGPSQKMIEDYNIGFGITKGWTLNDKNAIYYPEIGDISKTYEYIGTCIYGTHLSSGIGITNYASQASLVMDGKIKSIDEAPELTLDTSTGDGYCRNAMAQEYTPYLYSGFPGTVYLSSSQLETVVDIKTVVTDYVKQEVAKFVTGLRPLSELDAYFNELESMGVQKWLDIYTDYYKKMNN